VAAVPKALSEFEDVRRYLGDIAANQEEVALFLDDVFAQLQQLWSELADRENKLVERHKAWRCEQEQAERELAARRQQLEAGQAALAEEKSRIAAKDPNGTLIGQRHVGTRSGPPAASCGG
jgi:hypothetical protein